MYILQDILYDSYTPQVYVIVYAYCIQFSFGELPKVCQLFSLKYHALLTPLPIIETNAFSENSSMSRFTRKK